MKGLTKRENQVTDPEQILRILDTGKVLHLGLAVDNEPYVVPMNYGYTMEEDGKLTLYLHGAKWGRKLDVMRANPAAFVELECDVEDVSGGDVACDYGSLYASVMGEGTARVVEDPAEKLRGLKVLMRTQTGRDFEIPEARLKAVAVIRIDVPAVTAKARPK